MNVDLAIAQACNRVGIVPPRGNGVGRWLKTDTLSGRNGKGDGRLIINEISVTAWNWQTGEMATVGLQEDLTPEERKLISRRVQETKRKKVDAAERAAGIAAALVSAANAGQHAYLARKGFPHERVLTIGAAEVSRIGGAYLVPDASRKAIVMPARFGQRLSSVQLIWEDGTKKFLFGGEVVGASYRLSNGVATWLCEGLATGLSLRAALKAIGRADTVLCCFSASSMLAVARSVRGRCFIAADHDKPLPQFDGMGAGEFYAKAAERLYLMPPTQGSDINDLHQADGIFAVQRLVSSLIREARM